MLTILAYAQPLYADSSLRIVNNTQADILNIFVQPINKQEPGFFLRLDLSPRASDTFENPGCVASLRADTGLYLWIFPAFALQSAKELTFCADHPICLKIVDADGKEAHLLGVAKNLVPGKDETPVCGLDKFRPRMPMKDVCAIVPKDAMADDNGALLTGLGFAGKAWAARLAPARTGPVNGDTPLEHLELRRPLSSDEIANVLNALYKQDYVPWQAEFPGNDIDFNTISEKKLVLEEAIKKFLQSSGRQEGKNPQDMEKEGSIMLAPESILPALENADAPDSDVQLFTIILKPVSNTMIVDVAAYQGSAEPK